MVMLVSLEQASEHLRRDTTDDDANLTLIIQGASQAILNYLKDADFIDSSGEVPFDSGGSPIGVPSPVQIATLMLIGILYADRDAQQYINPKSGGGLERLGNMSLPRVVHWLLDPLRSPTLA